MYVRSHGAIVPDYEVAAEYPEAVIEPTTYVAWNSDGRPQQGELISFRCDGAVATAAWTVIDPIRHRLFLNQSYSNVTDWFGMRVVHGDGGFLFEQPETQFLPGKHVIIGGPIDGVWYHWLMNWAPRIALFQRLRPDLFDDPSVKFLIDQRAASEPFRSFIGVFGVPEERITFVDISKDWALETAFLVSFLDQERYYPDLLRDMSRRARESLGSTGASSHRRVFIDRQGFEQAKRRVANYEQIAPVLRRHGVESVTLETLGAANQVRLFSEAELVIGVHGAGLSNMVFCKPDCRVLIIDNSRNLAVGLAKMFTRLADVLELDHELMIVDEVIEPGVDYSDFSTLHNRDVIVDPVALDRRLTRLTAA